jgi:hypothetical protein
MLKHLLEHNAFITVESERWRGECTLGRGPEKSGGTLIAPKALAPQALGRGAAKGRAEERDLATFSRTRIFPIFSNLFSKGIGYRVGLGYRV